MAEQTKAHWDSVYRSGDTRRVSWYQASPDTSLELIEACVAPPEARVLDVGGGDSLLVDRLLDRGFQRPGVLDISRVALDHARLRLGTHADDVEWFVGDVTTFESPHPWDLWHDRAVLHFLVEPGPREAYARVLRRSLSPGGHAVIATFGPEGPERCSGLPVRRYDAARLAALLGPELQAIGHRLTDHVTPSGTTQQFLYATFRHVGIHAD